MNHKYTVWNMPDLTERFPEEHTALTKRQQMAYEAARKRFIADRADWYMANCSETELDVNVSEADDLPLVEFIKTCQGDMLEAALKLSNAVYREALRRAESDCDELSYDELMRAQ